MRTQRCAARNKEQLLHQLDLVSFAAYDALLYLDTHPDDEKACDYFREHNQMRRELLKEYADQYGPLTLDSMELSRACGSDWDWVMQPWPWEGSRKGGCC